MKRRTLLASVSVGAATVAGCLSGSSDGWGYRTTCELPTFNYEHLPDNAKEEVKKAFSDGEYEADGNLYYELLLEEPEEQALLKDGTYYVAEIDLTKETSTLTFKETTPTFDSLQVVEIENDTDETINFSYTIAYEDGGALVDKNGKEVKERPLTLRSGMNRSIEILDKYTTYEIRIEFEDGRTESDTFGFDRKSEKIEVSINEDSISAGGIGAGWATCQWAPDMA